MASHYHIQKPYVLSTLPSSLDETGCRYVVGDIYSHSAGSKQRRRPELVVGIDGEAANIYDVSSSSLITSYPIPPQSSFSCPPCSLRLRNPTSRRVARYTYIASRDPTRKIILFKDSEGSSGTITSTTQTATLGQSDSVVALITTTSPTSTLDDDGVSTGIESDLVAVTLEGSILCFNGENLKSKWRISPELIAQDLPASKGPIQIELVQRAQATDVIKGIFLGKDDAFSVFPQKIRLDGFNPDVLVLLSSRLVDGRKMRHIHILALPTTASHGVEPIRQNVLQIYVMPLSPQESSLEWRSLYRLDTPSGSLFELFGGHLASYTLAGGIPRLQNKVPAPETTSFLRLSNSSVLVSTRSTIDVYNPLFQSLQASVPLDIPQNNERPDAEANDDVKPCSFVAYFSRLEIAVAIVGKSLVATQLEPPKNRSKKRRADGLLIDSIGRGVSRRPAIDQDRAPSDVTGGSKLFSKLVPGSLSKDYWAHYNTDCEAADKMLSHGDVAGFERLMAGKFGVKVDNHGMGLTNGHHLSNGDPVRNGTGESNADVPEWLWPETRAEYPEVDRRWIMFALSRLFNWSDRKDATADTRLVCRLPESNVLNYLVDSGHLSTPNLKSALKSQFQDADSVDHTLGEELPTLLVSVDPTMELLLTWLYATQLGAAELLTATRLIMQSLELVQDPTKLAPKLLTFPSTQSQEDAGADVAENNEFGMELDRLEQQLQITEYYLGDETGTRARALSVAFGKLGSCPAALVIQGLRRQLKPDEILSLIYVLRMELVKDGWTSRYLDTTRLDEDDELEAPPDGSIQLLADLLCRCIDAVGPGGWLINDAILASGNSEHLDSSDFLKALTHEVSAALEGVQEAAYLGGILNEAIKYGAGIQRFLAQRDSPADQAREAVRARPVTLRAQDAVSQMLPLGLKAPVGPARHEDITPTKVVSGGEVVRRSRREFGHLTSKKIGPYTLERITI